MQLPPVTVEPDRGKSSANSDPADCSVPTSTHGTRYAAPTDGSDGHHTSHPMAYATTEAAALLACASKRISALAVRPDFAAG